MSTPRNADGQGPGEDERAGLALFVYGTLMFGDVVEALIGRQPPPSPAAAPGWRAARLPGRAYPGLVPASVGRACGLLLSGLTPAEWAVFDAFEGDAYLLRKVEVEAADDQCRAGAQVTATALTYAWRAVTDVEDDDWDPTWFDTHWLARYTARLRAR